MCNKKILLLLFLLKLQNVQAQSLKFIGLEAGINKEFSHLGKYKALDNKLSFAPSVLAEFDFSKKINLRTGINYFKGGFSYNSYTNSNIPILVETKINTLNIPVLASLPIYINNRLQLLINGGPNFYLAASGKITETGFWTPFSGPTLYTKTRAVQFGNDSTHYKRISYALNMGLGIRMFNFLELNANYIYGLSDYSNSSFKNTRKNVSLGIIYYCYRKPSES